MCNNHAIRGDVLRYVAVCIINWQVDSIALLDSKQPTDASSALHCTIKIKSPCVECCVGRSSILNYDVVIVPNKLRTVIYDITPHVIVGLRA